MRTEAERRAEAKYRKASVKQKVVAFYPADAALLAHAEAQGAFATYAKSLILADMERKAAK